MKRSSLEVYMENYDDSRFPAIVFEIAGNLYSINSRRILSILQSAECQSVPKAAPYLRGMIRYMEMAIAVLDLRVALGMESLLDELANFSSMIDDRKKDHVNWVEALERTVKEDEPFTLATDHHKCALGRWRDQYQSEIGEVNFLLKKLDEPHIRLHQCAREILSIERGKDDEGRQGHQKILSVYQKARDNYMPAVLSLLEETKEVFRTSVFRENILVLNGRSKVGLIVDKVLAVETLTTISDGDGLNMYLDIPCIAAIRKSEKIPGLITELDVDRLLALLDGLDVTEILEEEAL